MPCYSGSCGYPYAYGYPYAPIVGCGYGCGPYSAYLPYGPYGIPPAAYGGIYGCGVCRPY